MMPDPGIHGHGFRNRRTDRTGIQYERFGHGPLLYILYAGFFTFRFSAYFTAYSGDLILPG